MTAREIDVTADQTFVAPNRRIIPYEKPLRFDVELNERVAASQIQNVPINGIRRRQKAMPREFDEDAVLITRAKP